MHRITGSNLADLLSPSRCERRVVLAARDTPEDPPSELRKVLLDEGITLELAVLNGLPRDLLDLSDTPAEERAARTAAAVADKVSCIYRPALRSETEMLGEVWELNGTPDLLVRDIGGKYRIRDVKLMTNLEAHPEVSLQLQFYAYLYEQTFGAAPAGLEVHCGDGSLQDVPPGSGPELEAMLRRVALLIRDGEQSHEPRGVSKCGQCRFRTPCYGQALAEHDVSLVSDVSQLEARALYAVDVFSAEDLIGKPIGVIAAALDDDCDRNAGRARAERVLRGAAAMVSCEPVVVRAPELPTTRELIMFDVEDTGCISDLPARVLLWGLRGYGAAACDYIPIEGGFDEQADSDGWFGFLAAVRGIIESQPKARFVHWSSHEVTKVNQYVERYGDHGEVARRLDGALFDLLPVARASIIPPTSGFSLKSIEKLAGYERTLKGRDGSWVMAQYRLAARGDSEVDLQEVNAYNAEDLEATWAVMEWLQGLTS